jgi:adenylate kinase
MQVLILTGYPGSGKGTQGKVLSKLLDLPHVSTGELFRKEAKTGSEIGNKMNEYMSQGKIIPWDLHFDYLKSKLKNFNNGYILDGYPKDKKCLDFILSLLENNIPVVTPIVINIEISRDTAFNRLTNRLFCVKCELSFPKSQITCSKCPNHLEIRHDDYFEVINKRLNVFENNTKVMFPWYQEFCNFHTVNGEDSQDKVLINILTKLFPEMKDLCTPSTFHNHIDAQDVSIVKDINEKIETNLKSGLKKFHDHKIYFVKHLLLGEQINTMKHLYDQMPNFHPIRDSSTEAFSTCKMGGELNYEQTIETLNVALDYRYHGVMTEIEEELFKFELVPDDELTKKPKFTLIRQCEETIDWSILKKYEFYNIVKSKLFELHHGFDIEKTDDKLPISLEDLSRITSIFKFSFKNGGWFIFEDKNKWLYRSNEFSNDTYYDCIQNLTNQSIMLFSFLNEFLAIRQKIKVSSSIERVHAIWPIDREIFINTSNADKLEEYQTYLADWQIKSTDVYVKEPDADSITVIRYKSTQFPDGYIVDDVSLDIEGENIGTSIKSYIENLDDYIGKKAIFSCFIGIKTGEIVNIYKGSTPGKIVKPVGTGFGFGPYFLPDGTDLTLGQSMQHMYNARYLAIQNMLNNVIYKQEQILNEWTGQFQA